MFPLGSFSENSANIILIAKVEEGYSVIKYIIFIRNENIVNQLILNVHYIAALVKTCRFKWTITFKLRLQVLLLEIKFTLNDRYKKFLEFKFGPNSDELNEYQATRKDSKKFTRYIVKGAHELDSLYNTMLTSED